MPNLKKYPKRKIKSHKSFYGNVRGLSKRREVKNVSVPQTGRRINHAEIGSRPPALLYPPLDIAYGNSWEVKCKRWYLKLDVGGHYKTMLLSQQ